MSCQWFLCCLVCINAHTDSLGSAAGSGSCACSEAGSGKSAWPEAFPRSDLEVGGYGTGIGFCAAAVCCCCRCHSKDGCCGFLALVLPEEPLKILPLRVRLSLLPISQAASSGSCGQMDRLVRAVGICSHANLDS